jgi:hypothetical protein
VCLFSGLAAAGGHQKGEIMFKPHALAVLLTLGLTTTIAGQTSKLTEAERAMARLGDLSSNAVRRCLNEMRQPAYQPGPVLLNEIIKRLQLTVVTGERTELLKGTLQTVLAYHERDGKLPIYVVRSEQPKAFVVMRAALIITTNMHIAPLIDTTKAYKAGSTVPIKLQVLDAANTNISSAALQLKARKLIRLQDSTQTSVIDSGNSNPDSDFRFDSTIGGSGGYIYNLSTKNLNSGRYSLSMNVGSDKGFVYSVSFEVR